MAVLEQGGLGTGYYAGEQVFLEHLELGPFFEAYNAEAEALLQGCRQQYCIRSRQSWILFICAWTIKLWF